MGKIQLYTLETANKFTTANKLCNDSVIGTINSLWCRLCVATDCTTREILENELIEFYTMQNYWGSRYHKAVTVQKCLRCQSLNSKSISCCFFVITGVPVVGHEEVSLLCIVAAELQLQHVRVVPHVASLDVDGTLLLSSTRRVFNRPVHLVQSPLCVHRQTGTYYHIAK